MRPSPRPTSAVRWGRGAWVAQEGEKGSGARGWLSPRVFAQRAYPILTLEPRVVCGLSAPHPLAGGLAASLPERGALGGATLSPLSPRAPLGSEAPGAAPRPRPARASLRLQLPGTGSLSLPLPQRPPSQTQLCSSPELARRRGAWAGRGKRGVRGRDREGGSPAHQPSFLSVHLAVGRERQPLQRAVHRKADLGIADGRADGEDPPRAPAPWPRGSNPGRRQRTKRSLLFLKTWVQAAPSPGRNSVACSARWKGPRRTRPSTSTRCRWAGARGRWWPSNGTSPTWAPTRSHRTPGRAGSRVGSHLLNPAGRWRSGGPRARKPCRTSTTRLVLGGGGV